MSLFDKMFKNLRRKSQPPQQAPPAAPPAPNQPAQAAQSQDAVLKGRDNSKGFFVDAKNPEMQKKVPAEKAAEFEPEKLVLSLPSDDDSWSDDEGRTLAAQGKRISIGAPSKGSDSLSTPIDKAKKRNSAPAGPPASGSVSSATATQSNPKDANISCPVCGSSLDGMTEYTANLFVTMSIHFYPICKVSSRLNRHQHQQSTRINIHVEECLNPVPSRAPIGPNLGVDNNRNPAPPRRDDGLYVSCPYPACPFGQVELKDFPLHAKTMHVHAPQAFACPICTLIGDATYVPNSSTNLLTHLQSTHSDLLKVSSNYSSFIPAGQVSAPALVPPSPHQGKMPSHSYPLPVHPNSKPQPGGHHQMIPAKDSNPNAGGIPLPGRPHLATLPPAQPKSAPASSTSSPSNNNRRSANVHSSSHYATSTLPNDLTDKECSICFDEFQRGQVVATLACLCLFHLPCIDDWFSKKGKPECPLHSDD